MKTDNDMRMEARAGGCWAARPQGERNTHVEMAGRADMKMGGAQMQDIHRMAATSRRNFSRRIACLFQP